MLSTLFAMPCLPLSLAGSLPLLQAGPECVMHVLVAGGCRQEQQKEMQEHKDKEEMQDEMASQEAGAGGRC